MLIVMPLWLYLLALPLVACYRLCFWSLRVMIAVARRALTKAGQR